MQFEIEIGDEDKSSTVVEILSNEIINSSLKDELIKNGNSVKSFSKNFLMIFLDEDLQWNGDVNPIHFTTFCGILSDMPDNWRTKSLAKNISTTHILKMIFRIWQLRNIQNVVSNFKLPETLLEQLPNFYKFKSNQIKSIQSSHYPSALG